MPSVNIGEVRTMFTRKKPYVFHMAMLPSSKKGKKRGKEKSRMMR